MAFFSLGMVVVSTLTFILSTMEDQEHDGKETAFSQVLDFIDAGVIYYFTLVRNIDFNSHTRAEMGQIAPLGKVFFF